jgi:hypothetical protein
MKTIMRLGLPALIFGISAAACGGGEVCTPGTAQCICREGGVCDSGLACESDRCVPSGPVVGEEGGPCYTDRTCDAGLVCSADDICVRPPDGGTDAKEDMMQEDPALDPIEETEADGSGCDPVPGWPPDPEINPWYSGRVCQLPSCDEGAVQTCYDSSGSWTQTLTTISHTCGAMAQAFDPRLQPGHVETTNGIVFNTVGECEYDSGGVLIGVVLGATGITCQISTEPDGMGGTITVVETGVATAYGDFMTGTARAFLFDLPMGTPDCYADYDLRFDRE